MANNIPIITGATSAGGGDSPPPAIVDTLTRGATAALNEAEMHRDDYIDHTTALASSAHDVADTHAGEVWTDTSNHVIDLIAKADKAKDVILKDITGKANAAMQQATDAVIDVGGRPYVLIGDAVAANQAGSHWADAMNRLILPAIEQQKQLALNPLPPPPDASPYNPVVGGSDTTAFIDSATVPGSLNVPNGANPSPPVCPPGYEHPIGWPGVSPGDWDNCYPSSSRPSGPLSPLSPAASPPVSPPASPPPLGSQCPPPTIVINVPGCSPLTYPPGSDQPTKPPTAVPPPPTGPTSPPPPPPDLGQLPSVQATAMDGPLLCAALLANVNLLDPNNHDATTRGIRDSIQQTRSELELIPVIGGVLAALFNGAVGGAYAVTDFGRNIGGQMGVPNPVQASAAISVGAIAGFAEKWLGTPLEYWTQPVEQLAHYANPLNILSQGDIDSAYLGNTITSDVWECLTKSNGNLPWQHQQAMLVKRNRPNTSEIVQLYMRNQITQPEFYTRMRSEGVLTTQDADNFVKLATQYWTLSDLMTWMVKDVANEQFVRMAGLDDDFDKSWTPQLQQMADMIGVTKEQIKFSYRAQWQDIPLGQLFQMFWRLRPGRVDPLLQFTETDLIFMMGIQEVQPGFREKLKAIAYLPINRTDIMAAYTAGTMDGDEVYERFQDLGYNPDDAMAMTKMLVVKANGQLQSSMGSWTRRKINTQYIQGAITRQEADDLLSRTVLDEETRINALNDSDTIRGALGKGACIKGVKRRYYTGEYNGNTARLKLAGLGVELGVADTLLSGWTCERESRSKEPTVQMLVSWVNKGIITWDQMGTRLMNLGYTQEDANRIRVSTDIDVRQAQNRQAVKDAEKADKNNEKVRAKAEKDVNAAKKARRQRHMDLDHNRDKHKGPDPGPMNLDDVE